ncbi:MAG: DUF481 domain-containing protein [Flavobacteriales bacterium]
MRGVLLGALLILAPVIIYSQVVNIEQSRVNLDSAGWAGTVTANFTSQKYQSLFLSAASRAAIYKKDSIDTWLFLAESGFSVAQKAQFNNMSLFHARFNRELLPWVKGEAFTQMQYNKLLGLDRRNLLGVGLRYKLAERENQWYYLGSAVMLEYEKVNHGDRSVLYGRSSFYFSWTYKVPEKWAITSTSYFQPLLNRLNDYRLAGQHAFSMLVNKHWAFRVELTHFYDSRPPVGIIKSTFTNTLGLVWNV